MSCKCWIRTFVAFWYWVAAWPRIRLLLILCQDMSRARLPLCNTAATPPKCLTCQLMNLRREYSNSRSWGRMSIAMPPPDMKRAHRLDLGQDVSEPLILKPDDILAKLTPQRWFLWVRATDRFLWYFSFLKIIFDSILFHHCSHLGQILQAELLYICVGKYFVTIEHTAENSYCRNFGVSAKWRKWRDHPPVSSSSCSSLCEREAEAGQGPPEE